MKKIDERHIDCNGHVVDLDVLQLWLASHSWAAHNPIGAVRVIEANVEDFKPNKQYIDSIVNELLICNNYGFALPDCVFEEYSLKNFVFREVKSDKVYFRATGYDLKEPEYRCLNPKR